MRLSEFRQYLKRENTKYHENVKMVFPLADLKVYFQPNSKIRQYAKDERSHIKDGHWRIYPIAFTRTQVFIVCPYCGDIHCHGSKDGNFAGFRAPHCINQRSQDYELIEPEGYEPVHWHTGKPNH